MTEPEQNNLPFLDHLEELRKRIIYVIVSFIVLTAASYFFREEILDLLINPLQSIDGIKLIHLKVYDLFMAYLKISFYAGVLLSFPVIIFHISRFVLPALYSHERKWYYVSLVVITILFFSGATLTFKFIAPISIEFLIGMEKDRAERNEEPAKKIEKRTEGAVQKELLIINDRLGKINSQLADVIKNNPNAIKQLTEVQKNMILIYKDFSNINENLIKLDEKHVNAESKKIETHINIPDYLDWIIFLIIIIGLVFQLPLVITLLAKMGIVDDRGLAKFRPYALIVILIVAAIITPPDAFTQVLIGLPVYLLYEVSIFMARIMRKRSEKAEAEFDA